MSYTKTFMEDYFAQKEEIYKPIQVNYLIYNSQTNYFRSSRTKSFDFTCEQSMEVLSTEKDFIVFMSHPIDEEYSFIEITNNDEIELKIYDYYDFYDVLKDEINIIQEYTVFADCNSEIYNVTITKYSCNKNIDKFQVFHFSKID